MNILKEFQIQSTKIVDDQPQVDLNQYQWLIIQECGEVCCELIKRGASPHRLPQLLKLYFEGT